MLKSYLESFTQIIFILSGHRLKHALNDPEGFTLHGCEEPVAPPYPESRAQLWDEGPTGPVPHLLRGQPPQCLDLHPVDRATPEVLIRQVVGGIDAKKGSISWHAKPFESP
jgi:hypothetical protein